VFVDTGQPLFVGKIIAKCFSPGPHRNPKLIQSGERQDRISRPRRRAWELISTHGINNDVRYSRQAHQFARELEPGAIIPVGDVKDSLSSRSDQQFNCLCQVAIERWTSSLIVNDPEFLLVARHFKNRIREAPSVSPKEPGSPHDTTFG